MIRRRGTAYLLVLGASLLAAAIGLAAILASRVQLRTASTNTDVAEARLYARSGADLGLLFTSLDTNWRTSLGDTNWPQDEPIGSGTYSLEVFDAIDGTVTAGDADPLDLLATGKKGAAVFKIRAGLVPANSGVPLEILATTAHAANSVSVAAGGHVIATGGPLSSNNDFINAGAIVGDVETAVTLTDTGTIAGTADVGAPVKPFPPAWVVDMYRKMATVLPFSGDADGVVLAPGRNTYGGDLNPEGVYFIDAGDNDFTIKRSRVYGTLVVACNDGRMVLVDRAVLMHASDRDAPTLIVAGDLVISLDSENTTLSETADSANFNPPGAPYEGVTDTDQLDEYPNEIRGLVYVDGSLTVESTSRVFGTVVSTASITFEGDTRLVHDGNLYGEPPDGFSVMSTTDPLTFVPGTWRRVVD